MSSTCFPPLGSIEAVRPVFLIVMGVFLTLIAWRVAKSSTGWTSRMIVAGSLMLGFGYAVMMPLYEAGILQYYSPKAHLHANAADVLAWHVVKLLVMNAGWLLFGIGVTMHAKILGSPSPRSPRAGAEERLPSPHESIA